MIGLDTNVLVRYMAQNDPVQSKIAADLIERRLTKSDPGFISIVAMTETASVLERVYGLSGAEIARAIERTLQTDVLVVESEQEIFTATVALREGRCSFADALIAALGARAGCSATVTFDRKALPLAGFELSFGPVVFRPQLREGLGGRGLPDSQKLRRRASRKTCSSAGKAEAFQNKVTLQLIPLLKPLRKGCGSRVRLLRVLREHLCGELSKPLHVGKNPVENRI